MVEVWRKSAAEVMSGLRQHTLPPAQVQMSTPCSIPSLAPRSLQQSEVCLEVKSEDDQNCSVLCCVWHLCTMIHTRQQFLHVTLGFAFVFCIVVTLFRFNILFVSLLAFSCLFGCCIAWFCCVGFVSQSQPRDLLWSQMWPDGVVKCVKKSNRVHQFALQPPNCRNSHATRDHPALRNGNKAGLLRPRPHISRSRSRPRNRGLSVVAYISV